MKSENQIALQESIKGLTYECDNGICHYLELGKC